MSRSALAKSLEESGGWEVYDFLQSKRARIGEMTPAQQALLAIGEVHLSCQWEGVYITFNNVDAATVVAAAEAAAWIGRDDMASTLRAAIGLVPEGFDPPDHGRVSAWIAEHLRDAAVRASFDTVEDEWHEYGLRLDAFIERHSSDFFEDA